MRTLLFWIGIVVILVITLVLGYFFIPNQDLSLFGYDLNSHKLFIWVVIAWVLGSIYIIHPDQVGGVSCLGYPVQSGGAGPRIALLGIMKLWRDTARTIQREIPSDPERLWHGDPDERPTDKFEKDKYGNDTDEQYYVLPLRITTGAPTKDDKKDEPLTVQATVEPSSLVRLRIKAEKYMFNFVPRIGSIEEALRQIQDTVVRTLQNEFSSRVIGRIIQDFQIINKAIVFQVKELTDGWGIEIRDVDIKVVSLSHELNKKLRDVASAKADALITVITAVAERKRLIEEGTGTSKARELFLKGEAIGLKEISDLLKINKKQAAELFKTKAAETALKEAEGLTIFANAGGLGMETLFGLVKELKNT